MRIWSSESAGKKDFVSFLADTYERKPILVCEVRSLTNACIRNFTVANDPTSNKFSQAKRVVSNAVDSAVAALPSQILILDDWYDDSDIPKIDYFVMHRPEDSDALFRVSKPEGDIAKAQMRVVDHWGALRSQAKDKLLVLGYDERVRDLFDIIEEGDGGVEIRLKTDAISTHKYQSSDLSNEKMDMARLFGSSAKPTEKLAEPIFGTRTSDLVQKEEIDVP